MKKSTKGEPTDSEISRVMAELGRRGGKIGGKRRAEHMTEAQRSNAAAKAARARWAKVNPKNKSPTSPKSQPGQRRNLVRWGMPSSSEELA
jgi:phage gp16-like protein